MIIVLRAPNMQLKLNISGYTSPINLKRVLGPDARLGPEQRTAVHTQLVQLLDGFELVYLFLLRCQHGCRLHVDLPAHHSHCIGARHLI